jgi:hypothetical protein
MPTSRFNRRSPLGQLGQGRLRHVASLAGGCDDRHGRHRVSPVWLVISVRPAWLGTTGWPNPLFPAPRRVRVRAALAATYSCEREVDYGRKSAATSRPAAEGSMSNER